MKAARLFPIGSVVILIFLFSQQAHAQWADFLTSPGYSSLINTLITNKIWEASMANYTKQGNRGNATSSRSRTRVPASPPAVPEYRRYPVVQFKSTGTRLTLQEYLDSVEGTGQFKAELKELVLGILSKYEIEAAAKGYPNDLALALVSCIGLNSHVYHGKNEKPLIAFEQNIGLRDLLAEQATDNGTFQSLTDRQKQELYEIFVMLGGLTYHLYEKALRENNAGELKDIKLAAAQNLKLLGVTP